MNNYSLEQIINVSKLVAQKTVLFCLSKNLRELHTKEGTKIARKLEKIVNPLCAGAMSCTFEEIEFKLNITLAVVPANYKTEISIPNEGYAADLLTRYKMIKDLAIAYFSQFAKEEPTLFAEISAIIPQIVLRVDELNPTTLYFTSGGDELAVALGAPGGLANPHFADRVGIWCFYTDDKNTAYVKKSA